MVVPPKKFLSKNLIQIYTKTHQIASFFSKYFGDMPPSPAPPPP